jgi:hypothetical protein
MGCGASAPVAPADEEKAAADAKAEAARKKAEEHNAEHKRRSVVAAQQIDANAQAAAQRAAAQGDEGKIWASIRSMPAHEEWDVKQKDRPLAQGSHVSVSADQVTKMKLDGAGATLVKQKGDSWLVQPEATGANAMTLPAKCLTQLPPLPVLGVSADCLRSFRKEHQEHFDKGATTTDICFNVVKPLTESPRTSLAKCIKHYCETEQVHPMVAQATVFVSHAWRYKAADIFDAMLAFQDKQPPGEHHYFWFDIFTNDQHDALSLPQLWWREAFMEGVRSIGHTLLVLSPWTDPVPLTRAWCLWEILSTARTEAKLTVGGDRHRDHDGPL